MNKTNNNGFRFFIFSGQLESLSENAFFRSAKNKSGKGRIEFFELDSLKKVLRRIDVPTVVYLDITNLDEYEKLIDYLGKKKGVFWGVIDFNGRIKGISDLFLKGAIDYIGEYEVKAGGAFLNRVRSVVNYLQKYRKDCPFIREQQGESAPGYDVYKPVKWSEIVEGDSYAFSVMFIELDGKGEMERTWGKRNLEMAVSKFYSFVKNSVAQYDGRVWMWSGFSGIILFPFNGKDILSALSGFRLKLFKYIFDVEDSLFPGFVSFRVALHLGNIVYTRVAKGHVISDSINSVVHLGKKFAEPDNFCITKDVYNFLHGGLVRFFKHAGEFEGRHIYKMTLPFF